MQQTVVPIWYQVCMSRIDVNDKYGEVWWLVQGHMSWVKMNIFNLLAHQTIAIYLQWYHISFVESC